MAKTIKPSDRGELEITTVKKEYLKQEKLKLQVLSRGSTWLDTGTHEALTEATEFIKAIEKRTSLKVGCVEEIAWRMNNISLDQLLVLAKIYGKSKYGYYLKQVCEYF